MRRPKLLIVAGPNGSGKTSLTGDILEHEWVEDCLYVNPDDIARDTFGDWNSHEAILKAAQHAETLRQQCLAAGDGLIFETVMSSADKIAFIKTAKARGYFIRLFFIGTDSPEINAARITRRVLGGGHDVPIPKIISRYFRSISNCEVAAKLVDRLYVYDNSVENASAKLLFRVSDGKLAKQYSQIHPWADNIAAAVA
jgi:predicted ABC-type ATPase